MVPSPSTRASSLFPFSSSQPPNPVLPVAQKLFSDQSESQFSHLSSLFVCCSDDRSFQIRSKNARQRWSCCVGGLQLFSQISPASLWDVAFQVDRKEEERASNLSQKCPNHPDGERSSLQLGPWAKQGTEFEGPGAEQGGDERDHGVGRTTREGCKTLRATAEQGLEKNPLCLLRFL